MCWGCKPRLGRVDGAVFSEGVWKRVSSWGQSRELPGYFKGHEEGLHLRETVAGLVLHWVRGIGGHRVSPCREGNVIYQA